MQFAERTYNRVLQSISDKYFSDDIEGIIRTHTPVSTESYPMLWNNYQNCCRILNVIDIPLLYVTNKLCGINGLSIMYRDRAYIIVSRQVLILPASEQKFLLGHELGHCMQGHLAAHVIAGLLDTMNNVAKVIAPIVQDLFDVPLKNWFRESEFLADESGYKCCEDIEVFKSLLNKVENVKKCSAYEQFRELEQIHPLAENRINHLIETFKLYKS